METRRTAIVRDLATAFIRLTLQKHERDKLEVVYLFSPLWVGLARFEGVGGCF
jgi:hypothetical protein